jgi:thiol-disulfide isomerase/thioredoxin
MLKLTVLSLTILWGWCLPALAVSFELLDRQDQFQSSEQWQGKPTFVFVWKSDCPACQQELPDIVRFAQTLPAANLIIVTADNWQDSLVKLAVLPNNVTILRSVNAETLLRRLGNKTGAVPYSILLSTQHALQQKHLGAITLAQMQDWLVQGQ